MILIDYSFYMLILFQNYRDCEIKNSVDVSEKLVLLFYTMIIQFKNNDF